MGDRRKWHVMLIAVFTIVTGVASQDQDQVPGADLLCISECGTCPVICSPPQPPHSRSSYSPPVWYEYLPPPPPSYYTAQPPPPPPPPPSSFSYSPESSPPPPPAHFNISSVPGPPMTEWPRILCPAFLCVIMGSFTFMFGEGR
ncbi:hypothetical protein Dimus_020402 [Dionaea muscipula]